MPGSSLGHAAFFGIGAYTAGTARGWGWTEPISGLVIAGIVAGIAGYTLSFVMCAVPASR